MNYQIKDYQEKYRDQVIKHFENFQDYLIAMDPDKRLRRMPGYGKNVLNSELEDIKEKGGIFYVAVEDEKVFGFVVGMFIKLSKQDLQGTYPAIMGRIEELYVDPNFREQGIGTKLMDKIEEYFKQKGCQYIWVEVFKPNIRTHELYQRLGYEDRDIEMIKKL